MLANVTKMGFAGLLAAVLMGFCEAAGATIDFDAVILSMEGVDATITLRWGVIGLFSMAGNWLKRKANEGDVLPGGDPAV